MSESVISSSESGVVSAALPEQVSGGTMLRNAREAMGLHIAVLAVSLKVSVKKLEALEADRFDLLPDVVFVRALACSVCRTLKINPEPVLGKMPQTTTPHLKSDEGGINIPFRASGAGSANSSLELLSRPLAWVILALLAGALVLLFYPFAQHIEVTSSTNAEHVTSREPPLVTEPLIAAPVDAASAAEMTVPGSGATAGAVVFKAHGASWVEVIDANQVVQVRKNMSDGEIVGASGAMPLAVVVGRADSTEVVVGGKPFDLAQVAKDNVARFEVKQ